MALVNYGKEYGKLVVIVDVIDQNRVSRYCSWICLLLFIYCIVCVLLNGKKNVVL